MMVMEIDQSTSLLAASETYSLDKGFGGESIDEFDEDEEDFEIN